MTREELYESARLLPATPGVYIMHNSADTVIYVGKSKALKNRVSSYFAPYANHNIKTRHMVAAVNRFEVYHTKTELEALILENRFIKQYMPRYNIKLKDSSEYPYIELTHGDYPSLKVVYERRDTDADYYGPFSSASVAYSVLGAARKAFGLPSCNKQFPKDIGKGRPCLNYHIGQCMGVCVEGNISKEDYAARIASVESFLKGDYNSLVKKLKQKMELLSEELEFEKAAKVRDMIYSVKKISDKQHIVAPMNVNADVFGFYSDEKSAAVNVFFIRNGAIFDRECIFFDEYTLIDSETVTSLLFGFYTSRGIVPKDIFIDFVLTEDDRRLLHEKLSENGKVNIVCPQKGEKRQLCDRASANAKDLVLHKRETEEKFDKFIVSFASFLRLDKVPEKIEAYDVSNSGNENIVCGMAVWEKGRFVKKKNRTFNMRSVIEQNDYASMREALERRIAHTEEGWEYPDLILLDGGAQHVSVIKTLFEEKNIKIPVFGMIKDEHHKTRTLTDGENEMGLQTRQDIFNFIYKFQEAVHEAAFGSMDAKRRKGLTTTSLLDIEGVGKKTAELLLKHFGGSKGIKNASFEELAAIDGISRATAQKIIDYYSKKG